MRKKDILITAVVFIVLMSPGVLIDSAYWGILRWKWLLRGIELLRGWSKLGITYAGAFKIMNSSIGVLMTMVSLFLTMNINIKERSEKKVYGLLRKELPMLNRHGLYQYMKWISCLAPILMLIFLNLSFCVSGYLLYFYCYLFLMVYYLRHKESYGSGKSRQAVANKLVSCFSDTENYMESEVQQYKILLENIGKNAEKEGNWNDIQQLFNEVKQATKQHAQSIQYIMFYFFYDIIFWKQNAKSKVAPMQMVRNQIMQMDCETSEEKKQEVLWALFESAIYESDEKELQEFLIWLFKSSERNENAWRENKVQLPHEILEQQAGMVLILLEYRIREKGLINESMMAVIKDLYEYARNIFTLVQEEHMKELLFFEGKVSRGANGKLCKIVQSLKNDYQNHTTESLIANIIA